jgi:hypothetical protein
MDKNEAELLKSINDAKDEVTIGAFYFHYKRPHLKYKVLNMALNESDLIVCVVYQAQYGDKLVFIRPLTDWLDKVEWQDKTVNRFSLIK